MTLGEGSSTSLHFDRTLLTQRNIVNPLQAQP
jgi:hypothetical protein